MSRAGLETIEPSLTENHRPPALLDQSFPQRSIGDGRRRRTITEHAQAATVLQQELSNDGWAYSECPLSQWTECVGGPTPDFVCIQ